jgi:hypothetical protein
MPMQRTVISACTIHFLKCKKVFFLSDEKNLKERCPKKEWSLSETREQTERMKGKKKRRLALTVKLWSFTFGLSQERGGVAQGGGRQSRIAFFTT